MFGKRFEGFLQDGREEIPALICVKSLKPPSFLPAENLLYLNELKN
jgi:hypothetical protein